MRAATVGDECGRQNARAQARCDGRLGDLAAEAAAVAARRRVAGTEPGAPASPYDPHETMQRPLMASGSAEADIVTGPADIRHSCR